MLVPIDSVRESGHDMRRVRTSATEDAALTESIRTCGVRVALIVRQAAGDGYLVVEGHRRLRCARAAGLAYIPVDVQDITEEQASLFQGVVNMVRAPIHPVDQWRHVRGMIDAGSTPAQAAQALGLNERQARRMDRLANLHPKMLDLIERAGELPEDRVLRALANAPADVQAKAARLKTAVFQRAGGTLGVQWWEIERACAVSRIEQSQALFDPAAMTWDEDLFAQPDDPDRFTTADVGTFVRLQRAALERQVTEAQKKKRVQLAEFDARTGAVVLPPGWKRIYGGNKEKPGRNQCLYQALDAGGMLYVALAEDVKAAKAAEREKAKKRNATVVEEPDEAQDNAAELPPAAEKATPGVTKAALDIIAQAKTTALHGRLLRYAEEYAPVDMLRLMILAFAADNVEVRRTHGYPLRDALAGMLLQPGGNLAELTLDQTKKIAAELLVRTLTIGGPSARFAASGRAAEWIGAAIDAAQLLPRFDHPGFLEVCRGDELRKAAADAGMKSTGSVAALRQALAGKLPDWRPTAAQFGAPAPRPQDVRGALGEEEEESGAPGEDLEDAA